MPAILCPLAEVSAEGKEVMTENEGKRCYLMLFQRAGEVVGYHNVCPHQGRNLNFAPDRFLFDPAGRLVCPHHGALFDVADGECLQGPCQGASLRKIELHIEDGNVLLDDLAIAQ
ncbi:MAG: Rieske 2Fe-2S domain-containing protein [Xanthomonadales bacterium]|nr:Rieske 2Fe-2S domain-containing protein [Xanthomonadales bacterium]